MATKKAAAKPKAAPVKEPVVEQEIVTAPVVEKKQTKKDTWEFKDSSDTVLYEGGPYEESGEHNHEFDITPSECYTFTIYDSGGNGLGTSDWVFSNGTWSEANEFYELTTEEGDLVYTNTNFGAEESKLISTNYLNLNENNQNSWSNLYGFSLLG